MHGCDLPASNVGKSQSCMTEIYLQASHPPSTHSADRRKRPLAMQLRRGEVSCVVDICVDMPIYVALAQPDAHRTVLRQPAKTTALAIGGGEAQPRQQGGSGGGGASYTRPARAAVSSKLFHYARKPM